MQAGLSGSTDNTLESVRRRGLGYLGYLLWVAMAIALLWAANLIVVLLQRSIELLQSIRVAVGVSRPSTGPDWWILAGLGLFVAIAFALLLWAYWAYRSAWDRKLAGVWGAVVPSPHTRVVRLDRFATESTVRQKSAYLAALMECSIWNGRVATSAPPDRDAYRAAAGLVLREIEVDIAQRAVTAGLVIGLNRNPLIDTVTIIASALELQLHVLTKLGKRPSLRMWVELVKRASASIFLNTYVTREDALYLNLAIRKAALGLEVAADAVQSTLADIDVDEILGQSSIPGLAEIAHAASLSMSVGASGIRHIGNFIEHTSNDLLQGVMAGGILYYHGMAVAAECLALDEEHRGSPEMTRTISQAMMTACAPAGRILRDQVRRMREFLRERRRLVFQIAKENVGGAAGKVRDVAKGLADRGSGLFGRS